MSILSRIRAHGGDVVRDEWRMALKRGRLDAKAIAWIKAHWAEARREAWPPFDAFEERAAIREYLGGYSREVAERLAYAEIAEC